MLEDEFPEVYRFVTAVYPSNEDDVITSPYNSMLAMKELNEHADCVLPIDNQVRHGTGLDKHILHACNSVSHAFVFIQYSLQFSQSFIKVSYPIFFFSSLYLTSLAKLILW